jgi:carbon-monoxide dehydrogenase large subunit
MAVFGKAQYIKRVEDDRLLTGTGGFTDNLAPPNQAHLVLVRSPHAHARIVRIDTAAARKAAGVVAVFTWDDMARDGVGDFSFPAMFPNADGSQPEMTPRRSLAHEAVRYVGETVAEVVAKSRKQAPDAAELVEVEYERCRRSARSRCPEAGGAGLEGRPRQRCFNASATPPRSTPPEAGGPHVSPTSCISA